MRYNRNQMNFPLLKFKQAHPIVFPGSLDYISLVNLVSIKTPFPDYFISFVRLSGLSCSYQI